MKLSDTIMVNTMKRILFPLMILLFCFVNTSKADNLAPENIEGARTISTATANYFSIKDMTLSMLGDLMILIWDIFRAPIIFLAKAISMSEI